MKLDPYLPPDHPLSRIYRGGAVLFGVGLAVFGVLGLVRGLPFITTNGVEIFGLATNGLLAVISIIVGVILVIAALRGGAAASTTTTVIGVLFFASGLLNLAVLNSSFNILAFKIQNVVFSLVAGMLLAFLGLYGRVTGGLGEDNPFVRYRHHEAPDADHSAELAADRRRLAEIDELARAELAVAEGKATPEQELTVRAERARRAREARADAYRRKNAEVPGAANNPYY